MSDIRQKIVKALIKTKLGLTTREIAENLSMRVQVVNGSLGKMAQSGFIERGEYIEGEGQIWLATELGITEYGNKADVESLLTQIEKTPVETIEPAPIVEESPLEQKLPDNFVSAVVEEITATGDENSPVDSEIGTTETRLNKIELGAFEVFQLTDELASSFIKLMQSKQSKPIENIDYKIATLENLADIYNPKISATLREIASDLRG